MMQKLGTLSPVVYFVNSANRQYPMGHILLAPYTGCPAPKGFRIEYADTLSGVDRLQKELQEQELRAAENELASDDQLYEKITRGVVDRLRQRMISSQTSDYEKEFIRFYLQVRYERRERHRQRFLERNSYLWAREMDLPKGRRDDEESVNLDRISF